MEIFAFCFCPYYGYCLCQSASLRHSYLLLMSACCGKDQCAPCAASSICGCFCFLRTFCNGRCEPKKTPPEIRAVSPEGSESCVFIPVPNIQLLFGDAKIRKFPPPQILDQNSYQNACLCYFCNEKSLFSAINGCTRRYLSTIRMPDPFAGSVELNLKSIRTGASFVLGIIVF